MNHRIIKAKAISIAQRDGEVFKASNHWFNNMKKRTSLNFLEATGEAKSVNQEQVDNWFYNELPEILNEYPDYQIWNADETGLEYRQIDQAKHKFPTNKPISRLLA